jgi:hypothetical protein
MLVLIKMDIVRGPGKFFIMKKKCKYLKLIKWGRRL